LIFTKSVDMEKKTISGYVSNYGWDRDSERFIKGAWDTSQYMKNPVVLWAHNHSLPPIGRNVDLIEDDNGLLAVTEFDSKGDLAMQVLSLFDRGFLNAFSVGFIRKGYQLEDMGDGKKGVAITDAELYEYSAVSVPANPGALVSRDIAELAIKAIGPNSIECISTKSMGDQYLVAPIAIEDDNNDLEPVLKHVIDLAKIAKGNDLNEKKRGLITTAVSVFNDLLTERKEDISDDDMEKMKSVLSEFAGVISSIYPQASTVINKTILQIEKALKSHAA